jgi:hypothetical protein
LIASCGVAAGKSPAKPTLASLQSEVTTSDSHVLQATVASLQATVTTQAQTVSVEQTQLASPAAQNAFALGSYVTVDTTDATLKGGQGTKYHF